MPIFAQRAQHQRGTSFATGGFFIAMRYVNTSFRDGSNRLSFMVLAGL